MPYILSPKISLGSPGLWSEGDAYKKENIYSIRSGQMPPVNYDVHALKPHSLTHAEGSLHVEASGKSVDQFYQDTKSMYGPCVVIRMPGNGYKLADAEKGIYLWEISKEELVQNITRVLGNEKIPAKVIITSEFYPQNNEGFHDPNYVLILSQQAADYLVSHDDFNMYGTSWKSSDYKPGSADRPIHKTLFKKAIIFELLDLKVVPEGLYFFVGFQLRLEGASESPVTPVLFRKDELLF